MMTCEFCGTTTSFLAGQPESAALPEGTNREIVAAFKACVAQGMAHFPALLEAARNRVDPEPFARGVMAVVQDFDRQNDCQGEKDPMVIERVIEAWLKVVAELRSTASTEMNLPFLSVSASKLPKHLQRTLTAPDLAELAAREYRPRAAPPPPEEIEPEKKKKGWWPFG